MTIATLGYQLRSAAELIELLLAHGIDVLIDVRETAWSHRREFSKSNLEESLRRAGITYFHASFAGNPKTLRESAASHAQKLDRYRNYVKDEPEVLAHFHSLIDEVKEQGLTACLFCYERHPDDCHRSILLEEWAKAAGVRVEITHIGEHGAPRLA